MRPSDRAPDLLLAEELLLLALDDDSGRVLSAARIALDFGLTGALLMDLSLRGCVEFEDTRVTVPEVPADLPPLLHDAARILHDKPRKKLRYWMQHMKRDLPQLKQRLLDALVARGSLEKRESRVLWLFRVEHYPEHDARAEHDIRQRVDAVLLHGNTPDARTQMLIALTSSCRLIDALYPRQQRKPAKKRAKELAAMPVADSVGDATQAAISAATTAAAMVAITAATSAASTSACSASSVSC